MGRGCQCPQNFLFSTYFTRNKTCEPVSGAGLAQCVSCWRREEVQPRACVSHSLPSPPGCGGPMACGDLNLLFPPSGQLSPSALAFSPCCPSTQRCRELLPSLLPLGELLTVPRLLLQPAGLTNYLERYSKRQILLFMREKILKGPAVFLLAQRPGI